MVDVVLRATVNLAYNTLLPADVAQNVFHFMRADTELDPGEQSSNMIEHWHPIIEDAYNNPGGILSTRLSTYLANVIHRGECTVIYANVDLASGDVSPIIQEVPMALSNPDTDSDLPREVALCLSFGGITGHPTSPSQAARRRGRVYFGPFTVDALEGEAGLRGPAGGLIAGAQHVGEALLDGAGDLENGEWGVYSRAGHTMTAVGGGYVDNAWDTQRRRQQDATERFPFPVGP